MSELHLKAGVTRQQVHDYMVYIFALHAIDKLLTAEIQSRVLHLAHVGPYNGK